MRILAGCCILAALVSVPRTAFAQEQSGIRFAGLSPRRAFAESAPGKAALAQLTAIKDRQAREIASRNEALQSRERALQESGSVLSEDVRAQRSKELEKFRIDVRRFIEDAQADLLGAQRDIESAFLVKLRPAVETVAKEKGLQLIVNLDAESVVWADPALDITADVVKQLARAEVPRP
jgi:Skp family chaperone for outer membrane proteins